jgi:hypothetical protein
MKTINFAELENMVNYNDYTAFVYNDGTQTMYSGGEISDDTLAPFYDADKIEVYGMNELLDIKELMQENFLAELEPAEGVDDEGYNSIATDFENGRGKIAKCELNGNIIYMLVW